MEMNKHGIVIAALMLLLLVVFSPFALAEEKKKFSADKGRPFIPSAERKGYTPELEQGYKLTIANDKCAKCHTAARALNTIMYNVEDWKRYIKRMMNKPKANLSKDEAKLIYRFLKYDQLNRKEKAPQDFYAPEGMDMPDVSEISWYKEDKLPKNWDKVSNKAKE
ncbi:MAG: hypothetical protein D6719_00530 [Candidatus Dadabacteria bacterium]|nr:MAG: hypothetical protein D6719_00530 [Candidatus Dadabacteria bacterium]